MSTIKKIKTLQTTENIITKNYIDHLPELVLEGIFDNLKYDSKALMSCTLVSNRWDGMLWTKKQEFMFPLVLPLLAKRLSRKDVLRCRVVCQNWKLAVDGLNDQVPAWNSHIEQRFKFKAKAKASFRGLLLRGWTRFGYNGHNERHNPNDLLNCLANKSNGSPFPSRAVVFCSVYPTSSNADCAEMLDPDEILERYGQNYSFLAASLRYCNYFHEILRDFGGHISHLFYYVSYPSAQCTLPNAFLDLSPKYLVRMLNFVPHLRSLTIMDAGSRRTEYWNGPRPILPNLVSLTLRFVRSVPVIAQFLFSSYGSQLNTLECLDEDLFLPQTNDHINPFVFPNLKNLKLIASRDIAPWSYEEHFQKLNSSMNAPCLERLSIELLHVDKHCTMLLNLARGISSAFSSSLVELYVQVDVTQETCGCAERDMISMMNDAAVGVNLPRLTNLQINIPLSPLSPSVLCVLTNMSVLRELRFVGENEINLTVEELQRIWSILPSLQTIYFGGRVERRQEVELHTDQIGAQQSLDIVRDIMSSTSVRKPLQDANLTDSLVAQVVQVEAPPSGTSGSFEAHSAVLEKAELDPPLPDNQQQEPLISVRKRHLEDWFSSVVDVGEQENEGI